jgi:hypothetical protein
MKPLLPSCRRMINLLGNPCSCNSLRARKITLYGIGTESVFRFFIITTFSSNTYPVHVASKMATTLLSTAVIVLSLSLVALKASQNSGRKRSNVPHVDFDGGDRSMQRYQRDSLMLVEKGYEQYTRQGLPFTMFNYLDASTPAVVLPLKYLSELRSASVSTLSFPSFLNKVRGGMRSKVLKLD